MQQTVCGANSVKYTISKGQTLYAIAQQFNTTVQAILDANPGLDVQLYYAGDVICIPQPASGPSQETGCVGGTAYTIRRGDSFYLIAQRFNIPLADLLAANPGVDPARLLVGQVICVPVRAAEPCPNGYSVHTVQFGQTFVDLQVLYNVSYSALAQANPDVDIRNLPQGQQLCVAPIGTRGNCASGFAPYVMVQGDTLAILAARYSTSIGDILIANPLLTPTDFTQGRIICLPPASLGAGTGTGSSGTGTGNTGGTGTGSGGGTGGGYGYGQWYGNPCLGGNCAQSREADAVASER